MKTILTTYMKNREDRLLILNVLYLCLRCISWADGIEMEIHDRCLNPTFNEWMNLFLSVICDVQVQNFALKT